MKAIAVSDDKGKSWIAASITTHSSLKYTQQITDEHIELSANRSTVQ